MSTTPPPPPPGLPPGPPGPYGPPPPAGPRPGLSNKALFWIGVAVGVFGAPALAIGLLVLLATVSSSSSGSANSAIQVLVVLVPVALLAVALVYRRTRWVALGALAGGSVVLIVLGGACVALLSGLGG